MLWSQNCKQLVKPRHCGERRRAWQQPQNINSNFTLLLCCLKYYRHIIWNFPLFYFEWNLWLLCQHDVTYFPLSQLAVTSLYVVSEFCRSSYPGYQNERSWSLFTFNGDSWDRSLYFFNLLTPNVNYSWRTTPLTSKVAFYIFIQQIYVPNILNMV